MAKLGAVTVLECAEIRLDEKIGTKPGRRLATT